MRLALFLCLFSSPAFAEASRALTLNSGTSWQLVCQIKPVVRPDGWCALCNDKPFVLDWSSEQQGVRLTAPDGKVFGMRHLFSEMPADGNSLRFLANETFSREGEVEKGIGPVLISVDPAGGMVMTNVLPTDALRVQSYEGTCEERGLASDETGQ